MLKRKGRIRLFRGSIEFQKPIRGRLNEVMQV